MHYNTFPLYSEEIPSDINVLYSLLLLKWNKTVFVSDGPIRFSGRKSMSSSKQKPVEAIRHVIHKFLSPELDTLDP